jgi:hypothetical protein
MRFNESRSVTQSALRRRRALIATAAAAAAHGLWRVKPTQATSRSFTLSGSTTWNTAPWSPAGVPVGAPTAAPLNGDSASISPSFSGPLNVTFDGSYTTALNTLNLDGAFGFPMSFQQNGAEFYCLYQNIGMFGPASYTQTDGLNLGANLSLGHGGGPSGFGSYTLSGGTLLMGNEGIGDLGNGVFTQTGGTHTLNGTGYNGLYLGYNPGSFGTYTLSGTGNLTVNGYEAVGTYGYGNFIQTAGTHAINGTAGLYIGNGSGGGGTFTLSGGTLSLTNATEYVGYSEVGVFNQTNGAHSAGGISVGTNPGGFGTFTLNGGTVSSVTVSIGQNGGAGTFVQNAGSHSTGSLYVGAPGSGLYQLTGGTLSVISPFLSGAVGGTGPIGQLGQTNSISGLSVGPHNATSGPISLGGGPPIEAIGYGAGGTGTFVQTGGTHVIGVSPINPFSLIIGVGGSNTTGTYALFNGSLVAVSVLVGSGGSGVFNQSGGSFNVSDTLWISGNPGSSSGSLTLSGGTLTAGTIDLDPAGTFNQNGGTLRYTTFNMAGGTITGTLQNQGTFNYSTNGTFAGRLLNQGVLNPGSNFIAGNGMENDAPLTIYQGQSITLNGAGLDNAGSIILAGGNLALSATSINLNRGNFSLWGAAPFQLGPAALLNTGVFNLNGSLLNGSVTVTNGAGGLIVGPGTITAPFVNAGGTLAVQNGAMVITHPFASSGYIQLSGLPASLNGGAIANTGTIQGLGTIANDIANAGTIEAAGGAASINSTLALGGNLQNLPGGILRAATFNKILVTGGLAVNSGTINLLGGTFDNNNHPLLNAGEISGFGTLATSGLTNTAGNAITFTGGLAAINGPVTNNPGATIRVNYNPALFTGPVVNNGTIKTTSTTVTFASTFSGSGTYNSDPATNIFQSDVSILPGGKILGGPGDVFTIAGTYTNAGLYSNSGGTLAAHDVINDGSFNQVAGQATINALSGIGSTLVGGTGGVAGGATAQLSVASLSQNSLIVDRGGTVTIRAAMLRLTNNAASLQIKPLGTLDLNDHELLTQTSPATIKSYLANAYDPNGNADWNQPGLTSSLAKSDPNKYSLGYAYGGDTSAQDAGVTTLTGAPLGANQTVVRAVLAGDANMDGVVDFFDLSQLLGYKYNTGQPASYTDGDLNYDGVVDFFDLTVVLSANYNTGVTFAGAAAQAADTHQFSAVPEPTALTLAALGAAGLSARRRRRLRQPLAGEDP